MEREAKEKMNERTEDLDSTAAQPDPTDSTAHAAQQSRPRFLYKCPGRLSDRLAFRPQSKDKATICDLEVPVQVYPKDLQTYAVTKTCTEDSQQYFSSWPKVEQWKVCQTVNQFCPVQLLSRVSLFAKAWAAAFQASLSIIRSQILLKLMSIELVMPFNHLILHHPLLLLPSIFPIRVFSNESVLHIKWPKYWGFSFSISASNNEY